MKLISVILLASYFLARDSEDFKTTLRNVLIYWLCSVCSTAVGFYVNSLSVQALPGIILCAALVPALFFKSLSVCWVAGAATAFCALKNKNDPAQVAQIGLGIEFAVLVGAVFYQVMKERMLQWSVAEDGRKNVRRLLVLFALALLLILVYQKAVQVI